MASGKQECCPSCANPFTEHNPPRRLINCSHLVCQRCHISQKNCRKCGADVGLNDHFLKDYAVVQLDELINQEEGGQSKFEPEGFEDHDQELLQDESQEDLPKEQQHDDFYVQECLLHSKPADLICLDDRAIICSSCALFGKHKGHQVANREGILTKFTVFVEDCLKTYDDLKTQNKKFSSQIYQSDCAKMWTEKRGADEKRVRQKFQNLINMIRIIQKREIVKINDFYKQKQRVHQAKQPRIQKIQGQINKWLGEVQIIGGLMSDTSNLQKISECIPYIHDKSSLKTQVLLKGEKLLQNFGQVKSEMIKGLKQEKQTDFLTFDEQKINNISQYVTIKGETATNNTNKRAQSLRKAPESPIGPKETMKFKSSSKKEHLRTQTDAFAENLSNFNLKLRNEVSVNCFLDDNLLLSVQQPQPVFEKPRQSKNIHIERVKIAEEIDVQNIPLLSISDIRPVTNVSSQHSSDQSRFMFQKRELKQLVNDGPLGLTTQISKEDQKKKKKVDFPQKYRGIIDDLKNDRAQTIDLTGAEVGDGSILSLCPFIKKSKKLKILKLVKNKLTDDCLTELFEAVAESKINSLNLSQNFLTDKSCLIISSSVMPQSLKTITLSLNKINKRSVKPKIDELAKKNVAVLL